MYEDASRAGPCARSRRSRVAAIGQLVCDLSEALAHVTGPPLPPDTELFWDQALLDVLLEYPIPSDRSDFSIEPRFARLGIRDTTWSASYRPAAPCGPSSSAATRARAARPAVAPGGPAFVRLGFTHILDGTDHLLFLLCLVIPLRRFRPLVAVVTSFTVAHSITLVASALGLVPSALWFPPLIETLIAVSIVYMAFENIVGARLSRRWVIAFVFGLVHGFGFSFALRETLQFAGSHLLTSLLSFNVGVELGQLFVLAVLVPVLDLLFRFVVAERMGTILLSAIVAHSGCTGWPSGGRNCDSFPSRSRTSTLPRWPVRCARGCCSWWRCSGCGCAGPCSGGSWPVRLTFSRGCRFPAAQKTVDSAGTGPVSSARLSPPGA